MTASPMCQCFLNKHNIICYMHIYSISYMYISVINVSIRFWFFVRTHLTTFLARLQPRQIYSNHLHISKKIVNFALKCKIIIYLQPDDPKVIPRVCASLNLLIPHNIVDPLEVKQSDFGKESLILYLQLRLKDISSSSHVFASQNQQFVYVYMYVVYIYIYV